MNKEGEGERKTQKNDTFFPSISNNRFYSFYPTVLNYMPSF